MFIIYVLDSLIWGRPGVAVRAHAFPVVGSNAAGVDVSKETRSQRDPYSIGAALV